MLRGRDRSIWEPTASPPHARRSARILVVEDDPLTAELFKRVLDTERHRVRSAGTAAAARELADQWRPELILLDLILPDEDGLALCSSLRAQTPVPILVCSATRRARDELLSLKLGADDFIAKPFDIYHLAARVEALLRRHIAPPSGGVSVQQRVLRIDDLEIDQFDPSATVAGQAVLLTAIELRLLVALAERPGDVVPREQLTQLVWAQSGPGSSRTIDVHVGRLRAKLVQTPGKTPHLVSVRGFGYKLLPTSATRESGTLGQAQELDDRPSLAPA